MMLGMVCTFFPAQYSYATKVDNPIEETINKSDANIVGHIIDKKTQEHMPYVTVAVKNTTISTLTDLTGHYFLKNLPEGEFTIEISSVGYKTISQKVICKKGVTHELNFQVEEDIIALDAVVVSANRNETARRVAPTLVKVISTKLFETTNSQTLSQGLTFQPGVRVENDCQNCGFTQVRINGLDGKYTQILIDSRPIFSSLAGVYGLEHIPANMIERVEVVRGGGSALFGSSAIAGTVNIITKEPMRNSGSVAHSITNIDGSSSFDNNTSLNLSLVSDNNKMGAYIYGLNREKSSWDYNKDGFTESSKMKNQTVGMNAYYKTGTYSKISFEYHHIEEFRRGGSRLDLAPHIAVNPQLNGTGVDGVVEQTEHSINTGGVKFSIFSADQKNYFNAYAAAQDIKRDSYYGAYGKTSDLTSVIGAQYIRNIDKLIFMPASITAGLEYNRDALHDKGTDTERYRDKALQENPNATGDVLKALIAKYTPSPTDQIINISSAYIQSEWKNEKWSILFGGRLDKNSITKKAILSPRANLRYNPLENINIRLSYAEGFRAPQAFDEDLHISNIGGDLLRIERAKNLKEEKSHSINASVDMYHMIGIFQTNLLIEGFYTKLNDPFVLSAPVMDANGSGYLIQTRSNGSGAKVYGITAEANIAYKNTFQLQTGITIQRSRYDEAEEWSADNKLSDDERTTKDILRTPNLYGYFTASYSPSKALSFSLNGNYTGRMYVPHLWSQVNGTADEMVKSPSFFELGAKLAYDFDLDAGLCIQLNAGVQNILNEFQKDFDKGATRDSGYMYGPGSPRCYFAGIKVSF